MREYQPLEGARTYLRVLCRMADEAGDWQEHRLLESLHDVTDMVCRISDHTQSTHYRADKAGRLVSAALDVRCAALQNHAGPGEDQRVKLVKALHLEKELDDEINRAMWVLADPDGTQLWCSDAAALLRALRRLVDWAETIAATAVPEPADE